MDIFQKFSTNFVGFMRFLTPLGLVWCQKTKVDKVDKNIHFFCCFFGKKWIKYK